MLGSLVACLTVWKPKMVCIGLTAVCSFVFTIFMLIFGTALFLTGLYIESVVTGEDNSASGLVDMIPRLDGFKDVVDEYEAEGIAYVDEYMCTKYCPCTTSAASLYTGSEYDDNIFDTGHPAGVVDDFLMDCYD